MFKKIAQVAIFALALVSPACASSTYVLVEQQYGGESAARGATLSLSLTLSDSALQRGSFNLIETVDSPNTNYSTGDFLDFVRLLWSVGTMDGGYLTPTSGTYTSFIAALTFENGVPTGTLRLNGETSEFTLSGVSGIFSGTVASDATNCNDVQGESTCLVTGTLAVASSVPEPNTISILGFGLLAACSAWGRSNVKASAGPR